MSSHTVQATQVTFTTSFQCLTEASSIGLQPGFWPDTINLEYQQGTATWSKQFRFCRDRISCGELLSVTYQALDGTELIITND